ncbi:MAG: 3-phosphoshikimate 1-carboxyvinyltransferase [Pedosphaera sp.]|nr:3-phosphoshikimate 1-carboxyvinyltransferase [Pedosphaera sp.]
MLPELIEIIPPEDSVEAVITVPGSKSITNRALVLAALGEGCVTLEGALWSEDTQVMVECLGRLGFDVEVEVDSAESGNRQIRVQGRGGHIPRAGTAAIPLDLFVGNAGTAARFLSAMVCLGKGVYRLQGVPRMHERPQGALFCALRELGYEIEAPGDRLPAVIHGDGPWHPGRVRVDIGESSQFASALLLSARTAGWDVRIAESGDEEEAPYVRMTERLVDVFPRQGGRFLVEPDASSGSYFWAADWLLRSGSGSISVRDWPQSGWQIDAEFPHFIPLPDVISRELHLGDSIMTAIILGPLVGRPVRFTDLGRLRVQECERVTALRTELGKCGGVVREDSNTLWIEPSILHGAEIETYNDHRIAMCFATLGLKIPGMKLRNPGCVRKTFPNFFQKLAGPSPGGLGVTILDAASRRLSGEELFAG